MLPTAREENKNRTARSSLFPDLSVERKTAKFKTSKSCQQSSNAERTQLENAPAIDEHLSYSVWYLHPQIFTKRPQTPFHAMPCHIFATLCRSISIIPPHIQYQLPNLPSIHIPEPTLNGPRLILSSSLLVYVAKSYFPIVHPLSSKRPPENHSIDRDEAATISVQVGCKEVCMRREVTYRVDVRPSLRNMTPYCAG